MNNKVKITTKESAIRAIMNEILFGASDVGGNELSTTIPADLPISPSNHVATQLSKTTHRRPRVYPFKSKRTWTLS